MTAKELIIWGSTGGNPIPEQGLVETPMLMAGLPGAVTITAPNRFAEKEG